MYITTGKCEKGYLVKSYTNNSQYIMNYKSNDYTTPIGLVSSALCGCIIMCTRTFYLTKNLELLITYESEYNDKYFKVSLKIDREISKTEKEELLSFIKEKCSVSHLFSSDVKIDIKINENDKII